MHLTTSFIFILFFCIGVEKLGWWKVGWYIYIYTITKNELQPSKQTKKQNNRYEMSIKRGEKAWSMEIYVVQHGYTSPWMNRSFVLFATRIQTSLSSYCEKGK